ncbi:unnamed protein product [Lathyrus sativus]|nr:unnamed protein product [Lathyrus sativus]
MTTWTDANLDRRFYGCGMYKVQGYKKCTHFAWLDEEMNPRTKELISALLKKLNKEKEMISTHKTKDELKIKVKILKKHLDINWILLFVIFFTFVGTTMMK